MTRQQALCSLLAPAAVTGAACAACVAALTAAMGVETSVTGAWLTRVTSITCTCTGAGAGAEADVGVCGVCPLKVVRWDLVLPGVRGEMGMTEDAVEASSVSLRDVVVRWYSRSGKSTSLSSRR